MKNSLDFYKINDGKLGAINFNNMIPVMSNNYEYLDLDADYISKSDKSYKNLVKDQLEWLNEHGNVIRKNSRILYNLKCNNNLKRNIDERCCNFKLLEEKCSLYNQVSV